MTARVPFKLSTPAASCRVMPSAPSTIILAVVATVMMLGNSSVSWAQTNPLQLGTATFVLNNPPTSCPPGLNGSAPLQNATCYTATVEGCPSYQKSVTIPAVTATVAISTPATWSQGKPGTIFLHGGGTGEDYFGVEGTSPGYAQAYYNAGFQVVQIAWGSNWAANGNQPATNVLKYTACRPATLLYNVYTMFQGTNGAMCAQGHSAGSGAMAYALAWYNAQSYLNDVVLTSGPVFANIEAGCQYPATLFPNPVEVCPTGQHGCIGTQWSDPVQYLNNDGINGTGVDSTAAGVANATNNPPGNCNNYMNNTNMNTSAYDQNWHIMSVVSSGASYSYPNTSLYAFLCATGQSQNNSAAEGQLFYTNFTTSSQTLNYNVYRVNNCNGDEEIWGGMAKIPNGTSAYTASSKAMIQGCVKPASAQADRDISRP